MKFPSIKHKKIIPVSAWTLIHMSIARRLSLAFSMVLVLFAGTTAFAVFKMKSIEVDMKTAIHASTEVSSQAQTMRDSINYAYMNLLTDKDDLTAQIGEVDKALEKYRQTKTELMKVTHDGVDILGLAEAMKTVIENEGATLNMQALMERRKDTSKTVEHGDPMALDGSAQEYAMFTMRQQVDSWIKAANVIVQATAKSGQQAAEKAYSSAAIARFVLVFASTLAIAVGAVAAWLIARSVTLPLQQAVSVAEQVAKGDLSQTIPSGSQDETGALLIALSHMQDSLHQLVGEVRESAYSIELASSEVAVGNNDLSLRTEQTAGNLQQVSSSMEHLAGAVHQSAESAQAANSLVNLAAAAAERGGDVVAQVVNNMQDIAVQSKNIFDIIGVIDGIAFQTNILALNAAVEAARAGEQGRGFAVVASEVRNLAGRSAKAAKDIKKLIGASVEKVESGSRLVQDAGKTMNDIVISVRKVTAMINDISASTRIQSDGISEVSDAMVQLDQMTQQNAALVEQSAAAAESLTVQAKNLSQVVSAFTLRDVSTHHLLRHKLT